MGKIKTKNLEEIRAIYKEVPVKSAAHNTLDLRGKRFGHLVAIYPTKALGKSKRRSWVFKCDCGNYTVFHTDNVTCQGVVTCGPACIYKKRKTHELLNKKFGKLTVVEKIGPNKFGYMQWKCKCDCGNTTVVIGKYLESGRIASCGKCPDRLHSNGNNYINTWLRAHNIKFEAEYKFNDCCDKKPLPFDFVIFNDDGSIKCCIEYQGTMHFKATGGWSTVEHINYVQKHDKIKEEYCKNNNLKLVCILYTDFKNLDTILTNLLLDASVKEE